MKNMLPKNFSKAKIGFLGTGFVGGNLADNFKGRGFDIVKYSLEKRYIINKKEIKKCHIVFVAVPTPSKPSGFDDSILIASMKNIRNGAVVIIKSTILPTTAIKLQKLFPKLIIMHSPEFLSESTARYDTDHPQRNIVGISNIKNKKLNKIARQVLDILPGAPFNTVCSYEDAAIIKYVRNCFLQTKNVFFNMIYDLSKKCGADYNRIRNAVVNDPDFSETHTNIRHKNGRGAGGHCIPKDYAAFTKLYRNLLPNDNIGQIFLGAAERKNIEYLRKSKKDLDILIDIYGREFILKD